MPKTLALMKISTTISCAVVLISLVGCASKPYTLVAKFDVAGANRMVGPGPNTVKGSGLLRQKGGGVVPCSGATVALIPFNAYSKEWAEEYEFSWSESGAGEKPATSRAYKYNHPDGFLALRREAQCDVQGFFKFDSVADGEFYLITTVSWIVAGDVQGGQIAKRIRVSGGKTLEVVLTN